MSFAVVTEYCLFCLYATSLHWCINYCILIDTGKDILLKLSDATASK